MLAPTVLGSADIPGFRVYMHNAEISCRYYYIEFSIGNKIPCSYIAGIQQDPAFRKRRIAAACTKNEFFGVVGSRTSHRWIRLDFKPVPYTDTPSTSENEEGVLMYSTSITKNSGICRGFQDY
jgi:hypothetical protein